MPERRFSLFSSYRKLKRQRSQEKFRIPNIQIRAAHCQVKAKLAMTAEPIQNTPSSRSNFGWWWG